MASATARRLRQPRNLPATKCHSGTGWVSTCSRVPLRRSSLHRRMVSVLHRKISSTGIHSNIGRTSAMLRAKKASPQKNTNSVSAAKLARNSQAVGEAKKSVVSLPAMRPIRERRDVRFLCSMTDALLLSLGWCACADFAEQAFQAAFHRRQSAQLAFLADDAFGNARAEAGAVAVGVDFQLVCRPGCGRGLLAVGLDAAYAVDLLQHLAQARFRKVAHQLEARTAAQALQALVH